MSRTFYDCDVQTTQSSGNHSIADMVERAERLGFNGLVIADYVESNNDVDAVRDAIADTNTTLDVRLGAKLRPNDPEALKDLLREIRDNVDVIVVHGGDVAVNKTACGDTRADVLAHPEYRRKDAGLDHVAVKNAAENRVAIGLSIRQLLETSGKTRSHILAHMRRNARLATKFDAPIVATSSATSKHELRAPRELAAFSRLLGLDLDQGFATVSDTPQQILQRADNRHSDDFVQPGVSIIDESGEEGDAADE